MCTVASWYVPPDLSKYARRFADFHFLQFDIITTICDYVDIWCLTIKYPFVEETERKTGASKKTK